MKRDELEEMRRDALSDDARRAFRDSANAIQGWEREHPLDLADTLAWIDELRALFGDPPVDRSPWRGSDFRL
jgi:hypothetical protein